jgi:hypothetical protein
MTVDATDGGAISLDAIGAPSNLTLTSTADADDLTINVTGSTNSSLVLSSTGTGTDAVQLTASAGGIDISASSSAVSDGTGSAVDFNGSEIEDFNASFDTETGTTATLDDSDNGKVLIFTNSGNIVLTVPASTLAIGFNCLIVQKGAGEITLTAASGVTINNRNSHIKTADQWAVMTLICIDTNVFVSSGDGAS